jgi:hypothetical protein
MIRMKEGDDRREVRQGSKIASHAKRAADGASHSTKVLKTKK